MHKNVFVNIGILATSFIGVATIYWVLVYFSMRQNFIYAAYMLNSPVSNVMSLYAQMEVGEIHLFEMIVALSPGVRGVGLLISILPFILFRYAGATHIKKSTAFMLIVLGMAVTVFDIWTNVEGYDILSRTMPAVNTDEQGVVKAGSLVLAVLATFADEGLILMFEFAILSLGSIIASFRRDGAVPGPFRIAQDTAFVSGFQVAGSYFTESIKPKFARRGATSDS